MIKCEKGEYKVATSDRADISVSNIADIAAKKIPQKASPSIKRDKSHSARKRARFPTWRSPSKRKRALFPTWRSPSRRKRALFPTWRSPSRRWKVRESATSCQPCLQSKTPTAFSEVYNYLRYKKYPEGKDPHVCSYDQSQMSHHLYQCLEMTEFPAMKKPKRFTRRVKCTRPVQVYCTCRLSLDKTINFYGDLAQCGKCTEWFHQVCMNISD